MKFSIIVPTFNNLKYLKCLVYSLNKNSYFRNQLIVHVNDGSDGTLKYIKKNKIQHTHSNLNIGLCDSVNKASILVKTDYILYAHDDMFFCKNWDYYLNKEIRKYNNKLFYISGMNVSANRGIINYNCGKTVETFNEAKFDKFCITDSSSDLQGSHWAPHLIHKKLWDKIGGFSTEFNPGDGSDPDLCMKLWLNQVRIFKSLAKFKVYHFNSITTRKSKLKLNNGTKSFLLKYGFNPRFFRKYYLRGDDLNQYNGPLTEPKINLYFISDLIINKIKYFYLSTLLKFKNSTKSK